MKALITIFRLILRDQRVSMLRGGALGLVVLLMGAALLGLSGWFITAAAAAGLAGVGAVFDVFRPSAMVRFLALGRTAARYGERVLTHDATLRALAGVRVRLVASLSLAPHARLVRLRGAQVLNRLTADVDALDGIPLRLILPLGAGLAALAISGLMIAWLADARIALTIVAGYLLGAALILWRGGKLALAPSRRAEQAAQAFRSRMIDLVAARADLAVYGQAQAQATAVMQAEARRLADRQALDRIERRAGFALSVLAFAVAATALGLGMTLARSGVISPAQAAIGFFAALALAEAFAPLRRAMADLGRMAQAAGRVVQDLQAVPPVHAGTQSPDGPAVLTLEDIHLHRPGAAAPLFQGVSLDLHPGEWLALVGPSGAGKTTLLLLAAGIKSPDRGRVLLAGVALPDWDEAALRNTLTLVPQRSALLAGTIADNLRLAAPDADDAALWQALQAVALDGVIAARGGLHLRLGPLGAGLSGGEARRLTLARALLRRPRVLLLDEPTEGLDRTTADLVLSGIRGYLPQTSVLMASHRPAERNAADRVQRLI